MGKTKTHYADRDTKVGTLSLCGMLAKAATRDREAVTCRLCLGRLSELPFAPSEMTEDEPWSPPPEMVARVGARHLSDSDHQAIDESIAGEKKRPLFASMGRALEALMVARVDGYSGGSVSGSYEALGSLGTLIQHERRGSSSTTRQAESVAEVDRSLACVFDRWAGDMPRREAEAAFLLMEVGRPIVDRSERRAGERVYRPRGGMRAWTPMTANELAGPLGVAVPVVGGLRKWARRRLKAELVARGLVAPPMRPVVSEDPDRYDERLRRWTSEMRAIETRERELGR